MGVNGYKASSIPTLGKILINIRASISIEVDDKMIKFQFWLDCPFDTCRILVCPGQISNAEHCKWDLNQDIVQRVTLQSFEFQRFHRMSPSLCLNIAYFTSELLQRHWLCLRSCVGLSLINWLSYKCHYHYECRITWKNQCVTKIGGFETNSCALSSKSSNPVAVGTEGLPIGCSDRFLEETVKALEENQREEWSKESYLVLSATPALDAAKTLTLDLHTYTTPRPDLTASQPWMSWSCVTRSWT